LSRLPKIETEKNSQLEQKCRYCIREQSERVEIAINKFRVASETEYNSILCLTETNSVAVIVNCHCFQ